MMQEDSAPQFFYDKSSPEKGKKRPREDKRERGSHKKHRKTKKNI